jgi:eukaryotic-like serine/threonine-protein kinase
MAGGLSLVSSQPQAQAESPALAIGSTLGPYVIERVLGEGSMGRVYLGRHQRLGRNVALKVLHERLLRDRQLVDRLMHEGRVVNQINHAHIVEVHDFIEDTAPPRVYCVMEFLDGETLSHRLATQAAPIATVISVARQIAGALGAAHAVGVVHRDLKPDNVFLIERDGRDDFVKVLDFGVAKSAPGQGEVNLVESQQGALLGTPRYMAPEQMAGLEVDARTDVYALGNILYELLAGKPPFEATQFGQLAADVITKPPAPLPKQSVSGEPIPPALAALTMACLSKQPNDRPGSMGAIEGALAAAVGKKKSPLVVGGVLAACALGAVGFALTRPAPETIASKLPPPPPVVAEAPKPVEVPAAPKAPEPISLAVTTQPPGAKVTRLDDKTVLGTTPLAIKLAPRTEPVTLKLELPGYEPAQRELVLDQSQRLELTLKAVVKAKPKRAVTDGVIDPF